MNASTCTRSTTTQEEMAGVRCGELLRQQRCLVLAQSDCTYSVYLSSVKGFSVFRLSSLYNQVMTDVVGLD